ncbi:aspartate/glutamate racemase family protein [uncultured Paracoccus sp.]|jgi:Asp/Glu/hydantoin racemase|uniref:aspartate/glutamate racemase family protein n=1 Tax=Paracoccus sp. TaxID=267 RepID=UPI001822FD36|nr:aspartate/glutamate racemase family protein [uncultured Paracoccus sp.]HIC66753.1 Asp/Glu racemase [Paracoccus sp. (in: a-proteobacteria)]|tara:strand:+ start:3237 stop:3878 length:642 start_codon:yes stop_codon:yes gene_type:complete
MTGPIVVINPNSNQAVTDGLAEALAPFAAGIRIDCVTLTEGPFGIESQRDVDQVALPLAALIEARADAAAFVIACYSDPGIDLCRETARVPVFGIQESGVLTALARGDRVGVFAIAEASIRRHRRYLRRMGVEHRLAGERALNMSVDESARGEGTLARLTEVGHELIADGADVLLLGCAGMARHRRPLQAALGRPVIDPTQAAVAMAIGAVLA